MSYKTQFTFGQCLRISDKDLIRVANWLHERTGIEHTIVKKRTHDIEGPDDVTYEHKADQQAHKTLNVCFEESQGGKKKWLYYCDADYLIVTSREYLRVFRWEGHLKDYLLFHMNGRYKDFFKWGGDDDAVNLLLIPAWRLRSFLECEEPWNNTVKEVEPNKGHTASAGAG